MRRLATWLTQKVIAWLVHETPASGIPLSDFDRLCFEIRPCDVLLVEGRSRVSNVIKNITQSAWTHAAIYIGRLHDIEDPELRDIVSAHFSGKPSDQLLIEAVLGEGTVVRPLSKYRGEHLRICRPKGLSLQDAQHVVRYSARHLGAGYDVRHLLDIGRLMVPYALVPRRWKSSLFEHRAGQPTRTVCSSMIAAAFSHVHFPILPVIHRAEDGRLHLYKRNTRLYTPRDFDYSPYFDIIKYPFLGFDDLAIYRQLPWDQDGVICNAENECYLPQGHPAATGRTFPAGSVPSSPAATS
jgi:hypothetical protein